jgi:diazepam-binding inhibitor (GABA receptor modulating acyl-CoA-binding protein)
MTDMQKRFEAAARDVRSLPDEPGTHELLELYALYKQATLGDVSGPRPGAFDVRARAKHDAWAKAGGLKREEAMARYVELVARLHGR